MDRRIDDRERIAMLQRMGGGRRESSLHRILRFSPLAGGLVLLLASCAAHGPVTGTHSNTPNPGSDASTPAVGTGPGSGQSANNGGGGTVSISFPGLPIGNGNAETTNGNDECIILQWRGDIGHPGVVVKVTSVAVTGPFEVVSMAAGGCTESPACAQSQFSSANNGGDTDCFAGVEYTGPPITDPDSPPAQGSLALAGELSCPGVGPATCQQYRLQVQAPGHSSVDIRFYGAPSEGTGSAGTGSSPSTGTGSPGTGSSPPASPGSAGTGPPGTGSP
jgi:hypothetical protein